MNNRLENPTKFMFAGNAVFTIRNEKSGNRFTYKIKVCKGDPTKHFLSVLTGSDNENSYTYAATIFNSVNIAPTKGSKIAFDAPSVKAFVWTMKWMILGQLPDYIHIYHEGHCGRCNRLLTVPESILSGIGPECAKRFG